MPVYFHAASTLLWLGLLVQEKRRLHRERTRQEEQGMEL
jgi:hypothetical protein